MSSLKSPSEGPVEEFDPNKPLPRNATRRHDLDVLRVACIVLLVFFHAAMPFNAEWDWFVVDDQRSRLLLEISFFVSRWRMALLFTIAGVGTAFALRRRTGPTYLKERAKRLLVPTIFATLVLVPPQLAAERMREGAHFANPLEFLRTYGDLRLYPDGNWSWHHMWFVGYLFCYSALALPFFLWLRSEKGQAFHDWVDAKLNTAWVYSLCLPMGLVYAALIERFHGPQDILNDWAMFFLYGFLFLYGYLLGDRTRIWEAIQSRRQMSLGIALGMFIFIDILRWNRIEPPPGTSLPTLAYLALTGAMPWFWVLAILGYGRRYLNRDRRWLPYANEAAYPVYILHQTVVVGLAYYVVQLKEPLFAKYLFLAPTSLVLTVLLYHLYIRPFKPMRFLFGMK